MPTAFPILFGARRGLWTPASIAPSLWVDASDASTITLNGSTVSQINDKSGNANHLAQTTVASQPTYTASDTRFINKPSIGSNTNLGAICLTAVKTFTAAQWFAVMVFGTGVETTYGGIPTFGSDASARRFGMLSTGTALWASSGYGGSVSWVNGSETSTTTALPMPMSLQRFNGSSPTTGTWSIGANVAVTDRTWIGAWGEVVAVSALLGFDDRKRLEGYLAWKWGGF